MTSEYDAWKLTSPYDDECPECGSVNFNDECQKCVEARDYAEGLADFLYEKHRDARTEREMDRGRPT